MNKKGFTLTEMLAVIIIIGIIGMVAVPAIINSVKSNNEDTYKSVINDIILTAQTYASNAGGSLVQMSVSSLKQAGYLTKKVNPIDNSELNGCVYIASGKAYYKEENCKTIISGIGAPLDICQYEQGYTWEFDFEDNGGEERFIVPCTGTYKLEVWGAQGGSVSSTIYGGYGGYSTGNIDLTKNDSIYVNVGGSPTDVATLDTSTAGGYNGGGASTKKYDLITNAGGGATHIAKRSGLLNTFTRNDADLLIVAGGGGGASAYNNSTSTRNGIGGSGGGYIGGQGKYNNESDCDGYGSGGTQTSGGTYYTVPGHIFGVEFDMPEAGLGIGGAGYGPNQPGGSGGGGGYYGGSGMVCNGGAGGGSGYIGNNDLYDKYMVCYSCGQTENEATRTISKNSNTDISTEAVSDKVKRNNGHARITLGNSINSSLQNENVTVTFDANGGTVDIPNKQVVPGSPYGDLPEPRRDGYEFKGWNGKNIVNETKWLDTVKEKGVVRGTYTINNNSITINAVEQDAYTKTYITNTNDKFKIFTKPNTTYTLSWQTSNSNLSGLTYVFYDNYSVKSKLFRINQKDSNKLVFTTDSDTEYISFRFGVSNSNNSITYSNIQLEEGSTATAYEPYYIKSTTEVVQGTNHTLTAIWEPLTYEVRFNANGGSGVMFNQTMSYQVQSNLYTNNYSKPGYIFTGWNTKSDGSGTSYTDGQQIDNLTISDDITLYAQWSRVMAENVKYNKDALNCQDVQCTIDELYYMLY